jgi:hypothetical protein
MTGFILHSGLNPQEVASASARVVSFYNVICTMAQVACLSGTAHKSGQ